MEIIIKANNKLEMKDCEKVKKFLKHTKDISDGMKIDKITISYDGKMNKESYNCKINDNGLVILDFIDTTTNLFNSITEEIKSATTNDSEYRYLIQDKPSNVNENMWNHYNKWFKDNSPVNLCFHDTDTSLLIDLTFVRTLINLSDTFNIDIGKILEGLLCILLPYAISTPFKMFLKIDNKYDGVYLSDIKLYTDNTTIKDNNFVHIRNLMRLIEDEFETVKSYLKMNERSIHMYFYIDIFDIKIQISDYENNIHERLTITQGQYFKILKTFEVLGTSCSHEPCLLYNKPQSVKDVVDPFIDTYWNSDIVQELDFSTIMGETFDINKYIETNMY